VSNAFKKEWEAILYGDEFKRKMWRYYSAEKKRVFKALQICLWLRYAFMKNTKATIKKILLWMLAITVLVIIFALYIALLVLEF
jgi:hypothetical protein